MKLVVALSFWLG